MSTSSNSLLVKQLIEFGLSEKEAKLYLALLELEIASVSELAKTANINRSSTYVVLESLKNKGLVGVSEDKKVQRYIAISPEMLLQEAKDRANKAEEMKNNISNIVPELKALFKDTKQKPKIKVYEGKEAVKQIYYDISALSPYPNVPEIKVYEDPGGYINILPDFTKKDYEQRKKRKIKMYGIYPDTKESKEVIRQYRTLGSKDEIVQIPKKKFMSEKQFANMTICGDEVWFDSLQDSYCISISKKEIANTLRHLYNLAWEQAKLLGRKDK